MKHTKKQLAFLLTLVMLVSLFVACNSNGKISQSDSEETTPKEETPSNIETQSESESISEIGGEFDGESDTQSNTQSNTENTSEIESDSCDDIEPPTEIPSTSTSGLRFSINDDGMGYTLVDSKRPCISEEVVIDTYNNLPVTAIGNGALKANTYIKTVTIGESVKSIGGLAFSNCINLETVIMTDSVTNIGDGAFLSCTKLVDITLSQNLEYIGFDAFNRCSSLKSLEIPDSVTELEMAAIHSCSNLESISIGSGLSHMGDYNFNDCNKLENITVSENNIVYKSINGNLYSKDGKTLIHYATGKTNASFEIPEGVEIIGERAFIHCENLIDIVIPDGVENIGEYAFYGCANLKSMVIGKDIANIGRLAFYECNSLDSIYYCGAVGEWNITIGKNNYDFTSTPIYYYSVDEPAEEGNYYWRYVEGVPMPWRVAPPKPEEESTTDGDFVDTTYVTVYEEETTTAEV